jgi:RNA polymerase sigma-70 factor (ECF subfamily)
VAEMAIFQLFKKNKNLSELSDLELISKFKTTDDELFFAELFKRYSQFSFLVCMKYLKNEEDSKEAVLEIFEKLLSEIKKHEIQYFKTWLYSVTKNHCLHLIRDKSQKLKHEKLFEKESNNFMEIEPDLYLNPEIEKEKILSKLENSIEKLKPEQKKCINLFYLQEKSYEEVSQTTGFTMNEVKSYLQNGKRNLKILLSEQND